MDVTFYVFMGFLVGIAVMCGLVIAVSVKDQPPARTNRSPHDPLDNSDRVVYKKKKDDYYTYNASGQKRKVRNVKYRDS